MIDEKLLEIVQRGGPAIALENAYWLVWPIEARSGVSAAMSSAQFVHFNAPVLAAQTGGRMEYFGEDGQRHWASNLAWPRANLEMARLPARANFSPEPPSEESLLEESLSEENPPEEDISGQDPVAG